jgi:DNA (cytosine-5)-methyltransferase 1
MHACLSYFKREYGVVSLGNKASPVDELVYVLLSEKTNEAKYIAVYDSLKAAYPNWNELLEAPLPELQRFLRPAGFAKRRAVLLKRMLTAIRERFHGFDLSPLRRLPADQAQRVLMELPGIGPKAARCVLLYCFKKPALPVDIHTYRFAIRLGIIARCVSYADSHDVLEQLIPPRARLAFHVGAVQHGRTRCFAKNPKCANCQLAKYCSQPGAVKPVPISLRPPHYVVDLFSGAGGLSQGFKEAGFQIVQAIEGNAHAASTYTHNHTGTDVIQSDIRKLDPLECLERIGFRPQDVYAIIGGPPCQGFSESNRLTRTLENPKNHLYKQFFRFVRRVRPAWFVMENVAGLRTLAQGCALRRIVSCARRLGYSVEWMQLNAAEYGLPQNRRRLFIIGNRIGAEISTPVPTHGPDALPFLTVHDAIADLPALKAGAGQDYVPYRRRLTKATSYQKLMRVRVKGHRFVQGNLVTVNADYILRRYEYIRCGGNWQSIPKSLMRNYSDRERCHTGIYHRLSWNQPAKVIGNFRKNMLIHPRQNRGISVREAARLQSFPDNYLFLGSIGFQQQQVADAVPPLLARVVANTVLRATRIMNRD